MTLSSTPKERPIYRSIYLIILDACIGLITNSRALERGAFAESLIYALAFLGSINPLDILSQLLQHGTE